MKIKYMLITYLVTLSACAPSKKIPAVISQKPIDTVAIKINMPEETDRARTDSFLVRLLKRYPQYFDSILTNRKERNVQIIYTEINRDQHNKPTFKDYYFNVDTSKYFYPASTVKLPTALLALQKLHELG